MNSRNGIPTAAMWLVHFAVVFALAMPSASSVAEAGPPVSYQRVFVPADRMRDWPMAARHYRTLSVAEFEELARVASASQEPPLPPPCQVVSARHTAHVTDEGTLIGETELKLRRSSDREFLLTLGNAIRFFPSRVIWDVASSPAAVHGTRSNGEWAVLVDREGPLRIEWELRGEKLDPTGWRFETGLPTATEATIDVYASRGRYIVSGDASAAIQSTSEQPADADLDAWSFALGQSSKLNFVVRQSMPEVDANPVVRESVIHKIDPSLDTADVSWTLTPGAVPSDMFSFVVDANSRIVRTTVDGGEVPFGVEKDQDGQKITMRLPRDSVGSSMRIAARFVDRPLIGGEWKLPSVRPVTATREESTVILQFDDSLVLDDLRAEGYQRGRAERGDTLKFHSISADAAITLRLSPHGSPADAERLVHTRLRWNSIHSATELRFPRRTSLPAMVKGQLKSGWRIDRVTSGDSEIEWSVEPGGTQDNEQRVVIPLRPRMSRAFQPVWFRLEASRDSSQVDEFGVSSLIPVEFQEIEYLNDYLVIESDPDVVADVVGDVTSGRLPSSSASPILSRLEIQENSTIVIDSSEPLDAVSISKRPQPPVFGVAIQQTVRVEQGIVREEYSAEIVPMRGTVRQFVARFSSPRLNDLRWEVIGVPGLEVSAREISAPNMAAQGLDDRAEAWSLQLSTETSQPFRLTAATSSPRKARTPLSLMTIDGAETSRGEVAVHAPDGAVSVDSADIDPLPPRNAAELSEEFLGRYAYSGAQLAPGATPIVLVEEDRVDRSPGCWAWSAESLLRIPVPDRLHWRVTYRLENCGRDFVEIQYPEQIELRTAFLNRRPFVADSLRRQGSRWRIPLPSGERFVVLLLELESPYSPGIELPSVGDLQTSFEILDIRTMVAVPPEYELRAGGGESWTRRLFGPFAQEWPGETWLTSPDQAMNSLMSPLAAPASSVDSDPDQLRAVRIMELLSRAIQDGQGADSRDTWGQILNRWSGALRNTALTSSVNVYVDARALAECGITPVGGPADFALASNPRSANQILRESGLDVFFDGTSALLSTPDRLPDEDAAYLELSAAWLPGIHAAKIVPEIPANRANRDILTTTEWSSEAALSPGWLAPIDKESGSRGLVYHVDSPSTRNGAIEIRAATDERYLAVSWSVFLITLGAVLWCGVRWPGFCPTLIAVAAIVSMGVGGNIWFSSSGVFLGAATAGTFLMLKRRSIPGPPRKNAVTACALVFSLIPYFTATCRIDAAGTSGNKIYQVLVAATFEGDKPTATGDVYVPETLWRLLQEAADESAMRPSGCLVGRAEYVLTSGQSGNNAANGMAFEAKFELHSFEGGSRFRISWPDQGITPKLEQATLNGDSAASILTMKDGVLECLLPDVGQFVLRVPCGFAEPLGQDRRIDLPPIHSARFQSRFPLRLFDEGQVGAAIPVVEEFEGGTYNLGPVTSVSIQPASASIPASRRYRSKQLLRIGRDSVSTTVVFQFDDEIADLSDMRIHVPAPWRAASVSSLDGVPVPFRRQVRRSDIVVIPAGQMPPDGAFMVRAGLPGASGIGRYAGPNITLMDVSNGPTLLGLAVDESLVAQVDSLSAPGTAERREFLNGWPAEEVPPADVYRVDKVTERWRVTTTTRECAVEVESASTDVFCSRSAIDVIWSCRGRVVAGGWFQPRVHVPSECQIQDVSINRESGDLVRAWSRSGDVVTAILDKSPEKEFELTVRGKLEVPASGSIESPALSLSGPGLAEFPRTNRIRVFRLADAIVESSQSDAVSLTERGAGGGVSENAFARGRLAEEFTWGGDPRKHGIKLQIHGNRLTLTGELDVNVVSLGDGWRMDIKVTGHVLDGFADCLRFAIADELATLSTVDRTARVYHVQGGRPGESEWQVYPASALRGEFSLDLVVERPAGADESPGIPAIAWAGVPQAAIKLQLPQSRRGAAIQWECVGLTKSAADSTGSEAVRYVATNAGYSARPTPAVAATGSTPEVRAADLRLLVSETGTHFGLLAFDLLPHGLRECYLNHPAACEILGIRVDEVPLTLGSPPSGRWRVPLASRELPQRIEVLFQIPEDAAKAPRQWDLPRLFHEAEGDTPIPVARSIVEVDVPTTWKWRSLPRPLASAEPWRVETLRLDAILRLLPAEPPLAGESSPRWSWWTWVGRLENQSAVARRLMHAISDPSVQGVLDVGIRRADEVLARWRGVEDRPSPQKSGDYLFADWAWQMRNLDRTQVVYSVVEGALESMPTSWLVRPAPTKDINQWLIGGAVVCFCAASLVWPRQGVADTTSRWPQAALAVLALAFMSRLHPWYLGAAVVLVVVATALANPWRRATSTLPSREF